MENGIIDFKITLGEIVACTFCFPLLNSHSLLNPQGSDFCPLHFTQTGLAKYTTGLRVA